MSILNEYIDRSRDQIINSLQDFLRIRSVNGPSIPGARFGSEIGNALDYILKLSESLGLKTYKSEDGVIGFAEIGDGEELVGIFPHLDIVPEGIGWTYPPFGAEIHDGRIYARGVVDDKGAIIECLYGIKAIIDCGLSLNRKVRIMFGTNEESGMEDGKEYYRQFGAPDYGFSPDSVFPVSFSEPGCLFFDIEQKFERSFSNGDPLITISGGESSGLVPDFCSAEINVDTPDVLDEIEIKLKNYCEQSDSNIQISRLSSTKAILQSFGLTAHCYVPADGKNAIAPLLMFLHTIHFTDEIDGFFQWYADKINMETDGTSLGIKHKDELDELTGNLSILNMNSNEGVKFTFNIKHSALYKESDVKRDFCRNLEDYPLIITDYRISPSVLFPLDHPVINLLGKVYQDQTGGDPTPVPIGGTLGKYIPNVVPFGPIFPGTVNMCHLVDESASIEEIIVCTKIYSNAIFELANKDFTAVT